MDWFQEDFGFNENELSSLKEKIIIVDPELNLFKIKDRLFYAGKFEHPTLSDLIMYLDLVKKGDLTSLANFCLQIKESSEDIKQSNFLKEGKKPEDEKKINDLEIIERKNGFTIEGLKFFHKENSPVTSLINDTANNGAVFQVASQFNCLEMVGPSVRPEDGITRYILDGTQGPACAISCSSALFYRNYLYNGKGQLKDQQINLLQEIEKLVDNKKFNYWKIQNGYCLTNNAENATILNKKIFQEEEFRIKIKEKLMVGINWDTEVNRKKNNSASIANQRICQVFCSTMALSYDKHKFHLKELWEPFCKLLLEGMYEATLSVASILAHLRKKRVKVFLTAIGGGVFGNPKNWIADAIKKSLKKHSNEPLDVFMVHYSSIPSQFKNIGN